MVNVYIRLINWGTMTPDDVPALWRYKVKEKLGIRDDDVIEHERKLAEKEAQKKAEEEETQSGNAKSKP